MNRGSNLYPVVGAHDLNASMRPRFMNRGSLVRGHNIAIAGLPLQ